MPSVQATAKRVCVCVRVSAHDDMNQSRERLYDDLIADPVRQRWREKHSEIKEL